MLLGSALGCGKAELCGGTGVGTSVGAALGAAVAAGQFAPASVPARKISRPRLLRRMEKLDIREC